MENIFNIDYDRKIKDFYCINDKTSTSSVNPRIIYGKDRNILNCQCTKCGKRKCLIMTNLNIYKDEKKNIIRL